MKIETIALSKHEAHWLSRNVLKSLLVLAVAARKDPKIVDRTTYRVLDSCKEKAVQIEDALKAFGEEPFEIELSLSRKQKKALRELVQMTVHSLRAGAMIRYEKEEKADYLERTVNKIGLLDKLQRKLK